MLNNIEVITEARLDAESIDNVSETFVCNMEKEGVPSKEVLKCRLCIEEVMHVWAEQLGEDKECKLVKEKHFFRSYFALYVEGKSIDPTQYEDSLFLAVSNNPNMVNALGLNAEYRYTGGLNKLMIYSSAKKTNSMQRVLCALVLALIIGAGLRFSIPDYANKIEEVLIEPVLNTLMRVIRLISVPLVFLSIVCGINGMEDFSAFGKIGKRLIKRIVGMTFVFAGICVFILSFLYPISFGVTESSGGSLQSLVQIILDVVPPDLVAPIQSGNALQIIFIAICLGIGMLFMSEDKAISVTLLNQLNTVVQILMSGISKILPALIFLCVLNLMIQSNLEMLAGILTPLITMVFINVFFVLLYGLYASFVSGMPYFTLLKHQLPTYLLALSTASSAAVFSTNIECCCDKLNVDNTIARFAIPFGQVLFMPGAVVDNMVITMFMAHKFGVEMTPAWLLSLVLMVTIISIASPPIPGGALSGIMIIFTQLGIPAQAIPLATTILLFSDYFSTACNITCLQQELLIETKSVSTLPFRRK